jgi:predicted ester cyclase
MGREEANKANIYRFVDEALNRGIYAVVDESRGEFAGQSKGRIRAWRSAFPDFFTTIQVIVADGDWVAFRLHHEGTHRGEFLGVAPTGKRVSFDSIVMNRFDDSGIVVENWGLHDHASVLEQLSR